MSAFQDKIVLVTGGSRGIGQAVVESFAKAGAVVVFTYMAQEEASKNLAGSLVDQGFRVRAVRADQRRAEEVAQVVSSLDLEHGGLDVLVNNAGITRDHLIMAMEEQDWNDVIQTNLTGAFNCIKPAAQLMLRRRRGAIVNLSSVAASRPGRGHANYAASKGGIEAMTKALAVELAPRNIRVNAVAPGVIATEMSREVRDLASEQILSRILLKRFGQAQDIANAVLFLAGEQAAYITGTVLHVDGGFGA